MALGRPKPWLRVSPSEREALERFTRHHKTAQAIAMRARIVLQCANGKTNTEVAEGLGVTKQWRQRFIDRRLDGLLDQPRLGAPRTIRDADVERVRHSNRSLGMRPTGACAPWPRRRG